MANNIVIRAATPADARPLAELRYEFRAALASALEDRESFLRRCSAWMSSRLLDDWKCWVAVRGEVIVGQIWMYLLEKLPNPVDEPERHGYITNLYVRPEFRGGIGGKLLELALKWAKQQNADAIVLWPTPRSRSLYQRHGFMQPVDCLELRSGHHPHSSPAISRVKDS